VCRRADLVKERTGGDAAFAVFGATLEKERALTLSHRNLPTQFIRHQPAASDDAGFQGADSHVQHNRHTRQNEVA
jgi:hypothetical protein